MTSEYAVFCGLDVGKEAHHACALDRDGRRLFDAALPQDEARLRVLFAGLGEHGPVLVVVDQPNTIGALPIAVARAMGVAVAYLPGLAMRRIADLHPGAAKTEARDAYVIADAARVMPHTLRRVDLGEEAVAELEGAGRVRRRPGRRSDPADEPSPRPPHPGPPRLGTRPRRTGPHQSRDRADQSLRRPGRTTRRRADPAAADRP